MSQFRTLSSTFRESLEHLGNKLIETNEQKTKSEPKDVSGLDSVQAFFNGPVTKWYASLDDSDKSEVDRLFGELNKITTDEILGMMRSDKHASPFGLVGGFFRVSDSNGKGIGQLIKN
jgi:hypothetical protein